MRREKLLRSYMVALGSLFAFACIWLCSSFAKADVIWEPMNSFYVSHGNQVEYNGHMYLVNGPEGTVIGYDSPTDGGEHQTYENGRQLYIECTYTDSRGNEWGMTGWEDWVPLAYMARLYDATDFLNDHNSEIDYSVSEQISADCLVDKRILFYAYPGSEQYEEVSPETWGWDYDMPWISGTYVDAEGHTWGMIGYYYGMEGWICVDSPSAYFEELYPNGSGNVVEIPEPTKEVIRPGSGNVVLIVFIVIAVIVVVTVIVLVVLLKKSKKKVVTEKTDTNPEE